MAVMNEIEQLKARVAFHRQAVGPLEGKTVTAGNYSVTFSEQVFNAIFSDLHLAIDGWEGAQQAFNLMMDERVRVSTRELEKARELARLLDAAITGLRTHPPGVENKNLANQNASAVQKAYREWLEEYRSRESREASGNGQ